MARIFITGSSDGLGMLAARYLVENGHQVVLHGRNQLRGQEALKKVPGAEAVLIADLCSMEETKQLAADVNALGIFDAIIHNAGVYEASGDLIVKVNSLAPYILTCLINPPKRLIYLSSGLHTGGRSKLEELSNEFDKISYSDSKLHVLMLSMAVARLWSKVCANTVNPGWVPTKMGGAGATDDLSKGYLTQTWLAVDAGTDVRGKYFFHRKERSYHPDADNVHLQDQFLKVCNELTGVKFPVLI